MTDFSRRIVEEIPRLRRYARALTGGHRENADDLVQDTLERAHAKRSQFRAELALRPWLFSIMHNVFINEVKRLKNRVSIRSIDDVAEISVPPTHDSQLQVREILRAVGRLQPELREVVVLVSVEEFSYAEAAEILEVPVGTVMSRLFRGRQQLRTLTGEPSVSSARSTLRLVQ